MALESGEGLIKVTGEVGTGKTLLCRKLLDALGESYFAACLPNPALQPNILRLALAEELGIAVDSAPDQHRLVQSIGRRLQELSDGGRKVVLCVDEAQTIPDPSLEALRLLTNLETSTTKLLQIVLFGQPELDQKLARPEMRQVRQRITYSVDLPPLAQDSLQGYLQHRLQVAGYNGPGVFDGDAIAAIYAASRGIPRLINIICNKAMMLAYGRGERLVGRRDVVLAARETEDASADRRFGDALLNAGVALSGLALATSLYAWWGAP